MTKPPLFPPGRSVGHAERRESPVIAACLLGALALGPLACSTKEKAGGRSDWGPEAAVVQAEWGSKPGQAGHEIPDEASPVGPRSLVVDADGQVFLLDQVNGRIQAFENGRSSELVELPAGEFEDLDLDRDGGFVLLDRTVRQELVFIAATGEESSAVALAGQGITDPGDVTALSRRSDGVWVEVAHHSFVRVTDAEGRALEERRVVGGTLTRTGDATVRTRRHPTRGLELYRQSLAGGPPLRFILPEVDGELVGRTMLDSDAAGHVYLGVVAQSSGGTTWTQAVVVYDAEGHYVAEGVLPGNSGVEEIFTAVRLGRDGNVYALIAEDAGLSVVKVAL